jgi:hypothetical protein
MVGSIAQDTRVATTFLRDWRPRGSTFFEFSDERSFTSGQAVVNGQPIATMAITGTVEVEVSKAVVVSAFEVVSRGRVVTVQVGASAVQLTASFIQLPDTSGPA